MRLVIYSDFAYRRYKGTVYAEQAFAIFMAELARQVSHATVLGRLDPNPEPWHFPLPDAVHYVPLPHYRRASEPLSVLAATRRSAGQFWRAIGDADAALLFGPSPLALLFTVIALIRRRTVVLGVRQDYVAYVRNRHPRRRAMHVAAVALDWGFRLLARRCSVVAVGAEQARRYCVARRLLALSVTLVSEREVLGEDEPPAASGDGEIVVLSVGRLDNEKNPLLLADVLAQLRAGGERWRLTVCGDGPLEGALRERLRELGVDQHADLRGFVPMGLSLASVYRTSDLFLHTSHTEGVPQVLFEAFAAGLAVVATDVGGVAAVAADAAVLVPPDDPGAATAALRRLAFDERLRARLIDTGLQIARQNSRERQCGRLLEFIGGG